MPYSPVEDVPDIETSRIDVRKRDRQMVSVAFGKILIPTMSDEFKDMYSGQKTEITARKLAERTVFMSHIAAATSCALVANSLKDSYGAKTELRNLWRELYESSLPAKALWNMYVKNILS